MYTYICVFLHGETVETVSDFIFLGSKVTTDGDCIHEIKSRLLLGRKVMTNLDSIFKSRDITLSTKVRLVKAMVFPVIVYGCESWPIKKAGMLIRILFVYLVKFSPMCLSVTAQSFCLQRVCQGEEPSRVVT